MTASDAFIDDPWRECDDMKGLDITDAISGGMRGAAV